MLLFIMFLLYAFLFWFTGAAAKARGRRFDVWAVLSLFIGIFAVIIVVILPDLKYKELLTNCPKCFGEMDKRATVCPHCRSEVAYVEPLQLV